MVQAVPSREDRSRDMGGTHRHRSGPAGHRQGNQGSSQVLDLLVRLCMKVTMQMPETHLAGCLAQQLPVYRIAVNLHHGKQISPKTRRSMLIHYDVCLVAR